MFKTEHGCPRGLLTKQQTKRVWGTLQLVTSSRDCDLGIDPAALEGRYNKCPSFSSVCSS